MKMFTSSAVYLAIVFGAGFVFRTVRVMWLVPMVGVRVAELTELPLMLAVVFFAARWVNRRFLAERVNLHGSSSASSHSYSSS